MAKLPNLGMTLELRDTCKIDAICNMTEANVHHLGRFHDSIGIFPEFVDGHGILIRPTTGQYFQMPYSALVPKSVSNFLVAGRITGGNKISHAAMRNMMCCTVSGQGEGAAAISIKHSLSFQDMDIDLLQKGFQRQGARLH